MALGLIFGGCIILIHQKMKLQSKNYEILNKQKLRKKIYIYLPLTCFLFRNSLTTIYSRFKNLFKKIFWKGWHTPHQSSLNKYKKRMFDSFVFLPLSTRAYFKGRAYIKIILKNHARSYFAGRSYYRGNTVAAINKFVHTRINLNLKYKSKSSWILEACRKWVAAVTVHDSVLSKRQIRKRTNYYQKLACETQKSIVARV